MKSIYSRSSKYLSPKEHLQDQNIKVPRFGRKKLIMVMMMMMIIMTMTMMMMTSGI